jgi:hypothetical protein
VIYIALALLLAGLVLGATGMKRLGRAVSVTGPWRPGAAILALIAAACGMLMLVKGAALEGVVLLAIALGLTLSARKRPAVRPRVGVGPSVEDMSRREAEAMLGVSADATPEQIEEAYRRLIRRTHPDHGGSPGLAAQLNAARTTLNTPPAKRGRTSGRGAEPG